MTASLRGEEPYSGLVKQPEGLPFRVSGKVVRGFNRGSKDLGCPTANIGQPGELQFWRDLSILSDGVYYGFAQLIIDNVDQIQIEVGNETTFNEIIASLKLRKKLIFPVYKMVCSIGYNPQYKNEQRSLEVHLLHPFKFNFYNSYLKVVICGKERDQCTYKSLDELKEAIRKDVDFSRTVLSDIKWKTITDESFFESSNIDSSNDNNN